MMINELSNLAMKILKPVALTVAMFWLMPLFELVHAHSNVVAVATTPESQTVIYKSNSSSVQFKT